MGVSDGVRKTALFLIEVYKEQTATELLVNVNALLLGLLFIGMMLMGYPSLLVTAVGGLFLMNSVWYGSNYLSKRDRRQ